MILRAALFLLLLLAPAWAADPPQTPFLRIEAGGHIGSIARLAIDASGRLLATAGFDKTIRLWSLPDGAPRGVLRPPIGSQQEGEIYAVALTPDGSRLFAGGATGGQWDNSFAVYMYDPERGRFLGQLGGLPAPIVDLAVSPDGKRLAAGFARGGIRVWDATNGSRIYEDRTYAGPVRSLVFDREGRLFTAAADGKLRAYDTAGRKTEAAAPGGLPPWGLAVSPDGFLLAVTAETAEKSGRLRVDVVSSRTLASVFAPDTTGLAGEGLLSVTWAGDGAGGVQLLAAGYARGGSGTVLRRWGDFGMGGFTDIPVARDTIRHILPLPGGGAVFAAEDPGWGIIGPDGKLLRAPTPPMADLRAAREGGLSVSDDGLEVRFTTASGRQRFALAERSFGPDIGAAAPPPATPAGMQLTAWKDSNAPQLNGERLPLGRTELARASAFLPDGSAVLLGTDTHLRLFGRNRRQIAQVETPAPAWAVAVSPDGGLAIAALLDGSLRWYSLRGEERLVERAALFAHADGQRWVLFTPEGFFDDGARGGNDLVGVHLNNARNQAPDWLSFAQAYRALYAPGVVRARLGGDATAARARLAELGDLRGRLAQQPQVELASLCVPTDAGACEPVAVQRGVVPSLPASAGSVRITVKLTDRGMGLGPLDVFVNDRNAGRQPAGGQTAEIPLDAGENSITLRIYDAQSTIFAESAPLRLRRASPAGAAQAGRLFVLAMGVDRFANPKLNLNLAVADAKRFAEDIKTVAAPLFAEVRVTALFDGQATRAAILAAFARLAGEVRPQDTFVFYVATHGVLEGGSGRFLLIPQDLADDSSWQAMARQAIDETTLVTALSRIQARDALLLLDTCHSGTVTADSLANVGHETGRYILAASGSKEEALDSYDGKNGVFAYALHEAFSGRAGQDADGNLGALALGEFMSRRVGQLARSKSHNQNAVFRAAQRDLRSFPVARVAK